MMSNILCIIAKLKLGFDFHLYATWQIQFRQGINRTGRRCINIQQALVRTHFKLFACFLVNVRRTQHGVNLLIRWQGNRAGNYRTGIPYCLYNLFGRFIY